MDDEEIVFASLEPVPGERFVSLRWQLGVSSFGMNLIVLEPGQRGRIHAHERQEEVYVVLQGELTLALEGGVEHKLAPARAVRVGPGPRRQLVNASTARVVLLALGGAGEHVGRDGRAWASWEEGGDGRPPQEVPLPEDLPGVGSPDRDENVFDEREGRGLSAT
jgi:quercetin dioxygenase-like cupin family protein